MRFCILGSGSEGNSTYVEHESTRLLLDAGLRAKELVERLAQIHVEPASLQGIFLSHEHHDHIQGAGALSRKFKVPIYISPRALNFSPSSLHHVQHVELQADIPIQVGRITITPFSTPHDSVDPLAFSLKCGSTRACIVTDIGYMSENVRSRVSRADVLIIESNHDLEMLRTGPYPWALKQRVLSNVGHLSNEALAFFFSEYFDGSERKVMLIHLSKQNNHPQLAYVSASRALEKRSKDTELFISLQDEVSDILEV